MFLFLCLLCDSVVSHAGDLIEVDYIYDGDTIRLKDGRHVRFIGINTPEIQHRESDGSLKPAEQFGEAARQYLAKRIVHSNVRIETDREQQDHYQRSLAYVFLPDGSFINEEMVSQGLAYCLYKHPNDRYADRLLLAQQAAMQTKKGIWGSRAIHGADSSCIGNVRSRRFHSPDCAQGKKIHSKNRISFARMYDAFYAGYAPCKRCIVMP